MLPCQECPAGDPENPSDALKALGCWENDEVYSKAYRDSVRSYAKERMNEHLRDDYSTSNKTLVVLQWLANPNDPKLLDGRWGYGHAALSLQKLKAAKDAGASTVELRQLGKEEKARWYLHEAKPRCTGTTQHPPVDEWQDPDNWYEDSLLDYFTAVEFISWWMANF